MLGFITWTCDPEIFSLGSLTVRWYGLLWAIGLMIGGYVETKIYEREKMPDGAMDMCFLVMVFSTIIGARIGHCFFYEWDYFGQHPLELLYIWKGGLSSHGGAFGILLALFFFSKFYIHKPYLWTLDRIVLAVAICGACIRLGNLCNHEIYGDPTSMPWAFSFMLHPLAAQTGMSEPSHPTQIYEMLYCLVTFGLLMYLYYRTGIAKKTGLIFAIFLYGIFLTRYMLEFIKRPQEEFEEGLLFNMGQQLSLPFVLVGTIIFLYWIYRWGADNKQNAAKSYVAMAALLVGLGGMMLAPLKNRQAQIEQMAAVDKQQVPDVGAPVMMEGEKVAGYLHGREFVSEEGNRLKFESGYLFINGQRVGQISGTPVCSFASSGHYISVAGADPRMVYRYCLRVYPGEKAVLLNLKDLRGNYHLAEGSN